MRLSSNKTRIVLSAILIAILFVAFGSPTQSRAADESGGVGVTQKLIAGYLYTGLVMTNAGITSLVKLLQATLYFKVDAEFPVVKDMWKIVRDFANMLFIVVLIAVAMGTVFNVKSFGFGDLDLGGGFLMQFLIAALLINFSLTIGGLIINGTQVINDTFLSSIGNFENRLGSVLNPAVLIGLSPDTTSTVKVTAQIAANLTQNMVIQLFFTLILAVILLFSLIVPVIFTLVRIPMLMILLVFAPGAWLLGILPGTRQFSKQWWSQFWGWNLFLPFYLLVLYFGLYFLSYQKTILESIDRTGGAGITGFSNIALSTIFFYFVAAMVLVMGTAAAAKASFLGGTSAGRVAGWARGKVGGWWFGGRFAAGAATGAIAGSIQGARAGAEKSTGRAITGALGGAFGGAVGGLFGSKEVLEGAQKGAQARYEQIRREGLPRQFGKYGQKLYGGKRATEQLAAEAGAVASGGLLGLPLTEQQVAAQKSLIDSSESEAKRLEQQYKLGQITIEQLKNQASKLGGNTSRGFAYRKVLAQLGEIDQNLFMSTLNDLRGNVMAIEDFVSKTKDQGKTLTKITEAQFNEALNIMGGPTSGVSKSFLKDMQKIRPDFAFNYRLGKNLVTIPTGKTPAQERVGAIRKSMGEIKAVANMPLSLWTSPDFGVALQEKFNNPNLSRDAKNNMRNKMQEELQESDGGAEKLAKFSELIPNENTSNTEPPVIPGQQVNPNNIIDLRQQNK